MNPQCINNEAIALNKYILKREAVAIEAAPKLADLTINQLMGYVSEDRICSLLLSTLYPKKNETVYGQLSGCSLIFHPDMWKLASADGYEFADAVKNTQEKLWVLLEYVIEQLELTELEIYGLWRPSQQDKSGVHSSGRRMFIILCQ